MSGPLLNFILKMSSSRFPSRKKIIFGNMSQCKAIAKILFWSLQEPASDLCRNLCPVSSSYQCVSH